MEKRAKGLVELLREHIAQKIGTAIGKVEQDKHLYYFSDQWSMHELMMYLLDIVGPSRVWLSGFSISEIAVRSFLSCMEKQLILELHCLMDYTLKRNKMDLLYFQSNVATRIALSPNHSKVIVFENEQLPLVVVSSQNFNVNKRTEAGVVCTVPAVVQQFQKQLSDAIDKAVPLSYD